MVDEIVLPFDTTLMEVLEDMIFIVKVEDDSPFTYAYFNQVAKDLSNIDHTALGKTFSEVRDDELSTLLNEKYGQVLETKKIVMYEDSYISSFNTVEYSHTRVTPLFDENGICTYIMGVTRNITNEKLAQIDSTNSWMKLVESEKIFRIIAENAQDVIVLINDKHEYLYVSPSSKAVFGLKSEEYIGNSALLHVHPEDKPRLEKKFSQAMASFETYSLRLRIKHSKGGWLWAELKGSPVNDEWYNFKHMVVVIRDVTLQKKNEEQLEYFAYHDFLTDLPNRRYFTDQLSIKLSGNQGCGFAVCLLDIDNFKQINDQFGHDVGDFVIQEFGRRLSRTVAQNAIAARYGGDEFVVLLPNVESELLAQNVAKEIQLAMEELWLTNKIILNVTTSIGIVLVSSCNATVTSVLQQADDAMYKAKKAGKNCFQVVKCV